MRRWAVCSWLGIVAISGCAYPYARPAGPPMMMPSTSYAPGVQGAPIAMAPGVTTFAPTTANSNSITYLNVRPGDTVSSVASFYGVPESEIRKANNLGPSDKISAGQLVRIPDGATAIR